MPVLTRRRQREVPQESWHIFYGDVQVGWVGERAGVPKGVEQWGWSCGFHPRDRYLSGEAMSFAEARAAFEDAWRAYQPYCSDEDFAEHRYQRAFTTWKYAMWDAGCRIPTQTVSGITKCFCGVMLNNRTSAEHIRARHMEITA